MKHGQSSLPATVADLAELEKLFAEHRSRLLAMVERRLDPGFAGRIDADDILNDTFLDAQQWPAFRQQTELPAYVWLYGIVRDKLIQTWRRENRACRDPKREMPWPEHSSVQLGLRLIGLGSSPSAVRAPRGVRKHIREAVEMLNGKDREVLTMRHFEELTLREIAQILKLRETAVTMRYVRALGRFKDLWQQLHLKEGQKH